MRPENTFDRMFITMFPSFEPEAEKPLKGFNFLRERDETQAEKVKAFFDRLNDGILTKEERKVYVVIRLALEKYPLCSDSSYLELSGDLKSVFDRWFKDARAKYLILRDLHRRPEQEKVYATMSLLDPSHSPFLADDYRWSEVRADKSP